MLRVLASFCLGLLVSTVATTTIDDFPSDLQKWIDTDPPTHQNRRWGTANGSQYEWLVTLEKDRPHVRLRTEKDNAPAPLPFALERSTKERRHSVKVSDGWIVGFNAGEFGGGLWWFSPDGTERYRIQKDTRIRGFIETEAGLLALEGLAHLSHNRGRILRVTQAPGEHWQSEDLIDLKQVPEVFAKINDDSLMIATTDRLLRIEPSTKKVDVLVDKAFWGGLYPNSMIITPEGVVFLGMRHGVAKVEQTKRVVESSVALAEQGLQLTEARESDWITRGPREIGNRHFVATPRQFGQNRIGLDALTAWELPMLASRVVWVFASLALACAMPVPSNCSERPPIGSKVEKLEFKDIRFLTRTLADFKSRKAVVIIANRSSCPISQKYLPVLSALEKEYRDRSVQFLALNVGDESITEMAAQAVESDVAFPFVKDINLQCAKALGLRRTPEVVVLDADHRIRYRGRIDDQFRLGGDRSDATQHPLREAIEDVFAGRKVAQEETTVDGCLISLTEASKSATSLNFAEHVAPIVQKHCQDCHHAGGQAPFSLMNYRDVASQSAMIAEVVDDRRMPPWYGSERHGTFVNRRGLSEGERETLLQWIRDGAKSGDLSKLPVARKFSTDKWHIGEPDLVTTTPFDHTIPATGFVDYKYAIFPHVFAEDTWVQAVEILPDNPRVVHHANLAFMKIGERPREENFITGKVPGGDPMDLDEGTCVLIPKGSVIGLQIHYTTTGKPERSKISVGMRFPRVPVKKQLYCEQVHTTRFKIPPLDPAYPVTARRSVQFDATGVGLFSHMHLRGKDMTFLAKLPDGSSDTLLVIPNYNFDWQQSYRWSPGTKKFPKGTTFEVVAHFDNSEFNPYNPDPKATVGNGDQTFNEMMYGFYFFTRDDENLNLRIDPKTGFIAATDSSATK